VTRFIISLFGVPIFWRSKSQKGVTLSSIEVEYVAMSKAAKEIRFIIYLLRVMGIPVKLPIIIRTENIRAVFMAESASSGSRTRHIDTRNHFIREHVEDDFITIAFIEADNNHSDLSTKNFNKNTYERHVVKFA
jgi:hypothetical protein